MKGRILWLHGFSEFSKVYLRLFDHLSTAGFEIFYFDQRGAGYTSPGKLKGITDEFHTFDDLDFFLKKNIDELATRENKDLYLMGHSMGGGISLNYGIRGKYKDHLTGIAVTGPLILLHVSISLQMIEKITSTNSPNSQAQDLERSYLVFLTPL